MNRSMSLDNMSFTEALSKAVNAVIRPPRAEYDETQISFIVYDMHSPPIPRIPLSFPNRRGERIVGSLYQSISFDTEKLHRCIIYLHGNIGSQKEGRFIVPFYAPHGISVFCFDFSGSGNSGGKYVTLGKNEKTDVIDVIGFLQDCMDIQEFILWGRSMGAACAIMATAMLTHEVDQHYDKLHQQKLASSTNNFYQNSKHANSFSLKRDSFANQTPNDKPNSILSDANETKEKGKNENTNSHLFQSTPMLEKNKNLLSESHNSSSVSNSPIISENNNNLIDSEKPNQIPNLQTESLKENHEKENAFKEEETNIHLNPKIDLLNNKIKDTDEDNKKMQNSDQNSHSKHLMFDQQAIQNIEADNSIPDDLKPVPKAKPRIRKAKSQFDIEKKEISKDKSDESLFDRTAAKICKPKTRSSLPPMMSPFMPSLIPKTNQIPIQDLIFQQNQSPHQTPLFKPETTQQDSTQSQAQLHIQATKPNHPHKMPKPPKPPKPPQHTLHETDNNNDSDTNSNEKKRNLSDLFDSDESSQGKKKKSFRIPVKGIIVDSAYSSLEDMLNAISTHVNLGSISSFVAQWYIKRSVNDQVGLTCKDVQPAESAKLCWRVPLLLGHSPKDDFIPFEQAQKIYNAYTGPKELVILSGGHNAERDENWMNVCTKFIATYFGLELEQLKQKITSQRPEHAASFLNLIQKSSDH